MRIAITDRGGLPTAATLLVLWLVAPLLSAQWTNVPEADIPLTAAGELDFEAPAPRLASGRIDLQGIWVPDDVSYLRDLARDMDPEDVPYQPWAKALFDQRRDGSHSREDPDANCLPQGVPKVNFAPNPWKIIETPISMVIIYETFTYWRQIFTDGRGVDPNALPTWMGYSTGTWEGDTFIVESRGFNGKPWLDQLGRPSTDQLHVTERFTRTSYGRMTIGVTIDDPGAYTAPWSTSVVVRLQPDWEPLEMICGENNKDLESLPGGNFVVPNATAPQ